MTHSPSVSILMYHAVEETSSLIATPRAVFARQMQWLAENRYQVLSLGDLVRLLYQAHPLPERAVVITFDDGFASVYTAAFPILADYGFSATVFLVTDYCGKHNDWPGQPTGVPRLPLLDWPQIREMARHGIAFGAHTRSHPRLDLLPPGQMADEIDQPQQEIADRLGQPAKLFAYPYGRYNARVLAAVGAQYMGACATHIGRASLQSDPLQLERVDAAHVESAWLFEGLSHRLFPAYLGMRRALRTVSSRVLLRRQWV